MLSEFNPFSLEGKTVLVTGASSGIGKQIAIDCSKMGAKVLLTGRNEIRLNDTYANLYGEGHTLFISDLCDEISMQKLISALPEIDGTALCAGKGLDCPVKFINREKMLDVFNINFFSTTELIRLLYKTKKLKKGSSIVIIDSIGGINVFSSGQAIYGASKAALNSFMRFCAKEFSIRKIRVNCVNPGMIDTPLIHRDAITDQQLEEDANKYLCGRYGIPQDVSNGVIYLLSDASSWVTGTSLFIDGGRSII